MEMSPRGLDFRAKRGSKLQMTYATLVAPKSADAVPAVHVLAQKLQVYGRPLKSYVVAVNVAGGVVSACVDVGVRTDQGPLLLHGGDLWAGPDGRRCQRGCWRR